MTVAVVVDGVGESCTGRSKDILQSFCMKLPEEDCLPALKLPYREDKCGKYEISCDGDRCVNGLAVCDLERDCEDAKDERYW